MNVVPNRRFVLVVRADPVICGHAGEARNLAEAALNRGFDDVRIVTWPVEVLVETGLPLKREGGVMPYSDGIVVERPGPVGDYRVPDGRYLAGMVGRLVELFTDGVPTVCMSLYISPHALVVAEALRVAHSTGLPVRVTTIAEAVGSDITNVVRSCAADDRFGAAAHALATYLDNDLCVAVSRYTKELIVSSAAEVDARHGTHFAERCEDRVRISYPAIDASAYLDLCPDLLGASLRNRGLEKDGYLLFLSRLAAAKGADDLILGYAMSEARHRARLVIAGDGPRSAALRALALATGVGDRIIFYDDIDDVEKPYLMRGSLAFVLPSKPRAEFVETFGIALAEKMMAGGGPVITTDTGGIAETVGGCALIVPAESPTAIAAALDRVVDLSADATRAMEVQARAYSLQFDRVRIFDQLMDHLFLAGVRAEDPYGPQSDAGHEPLRLPG